MKKFLLSALCLCSFGIANAEDIVYFEPQVSEKNVDIESDDCGTLSLRLANSATYIGAQFTIYIPDQLTFDKSYFHAGSRLPVKKGNLKHTISVSAVTSDIPGFSAYLVYIFSMEKEAFVGKSGDELVSFDFGTKDVDGVFPIYIKDIKLGISATSGNDFDAATSYVTVGTPSNASLALKGVVPEAINASLATETGLASLDLSAVTALNGEFAYVAGRDVVAPADVTTSVKYVGKGANYYSVNIPFGGAVTGTGKVYELTSTTSDYAHFEEVSSVVANKTYLAEGEVTIAANAAVAVAGVAKQTGAEGSYVLEGQFWHGKNLTVPATRGLFEVAAGSNLRVVIDGVLTNITTAQIEAGETSYDLQGRQVQNAKNGVFVVNGKKQFVK